MTIDIEKVKALATTVRVLSAEGVDKANSGHPGMPMGAADYASALWAGHLTFDPAEPLWANRDRFVLSAGHGSMLIYSLLHLFGYKLSLDEIKNFRQWGSLTPGHPEYGVTEGVETTTGPLGAGFSNGVGMALSARMLQARYSEELFNHTVYGIVSDGDLMEGVASEAASLAGHLELGNLVYLYDDNEISIGGSTDICFREDVPKRFEAYGWHVLSIDGHDVAAADQAIAEAKAFVGKPSIICAKTKIGLGSPNKVGTSGVHGSPLGADELQATKDALGWEHSEPFFIPADVKEFCAACVETKGAARSEWQAKYATWAAANTEKAAEFKSLQSKEIPASLRDELIATFDGVEKGATRGLSGQAIQAIAKQVPGFVGGSADLEPSTKTLIADSTDVQPGDFAGKNLRFGVREHAMGGAANGLAYAGGWIPYTATFLVFSDYMRPAIRLAALSHLQTIFIFTHDSFWVGEDGPTHQPIEHAQSLRMIPNLKVYRPADGLEVAISYWLALNQQKSPSAILATRQNLPTLARAEGFDPAVIEKGAYVLSGEDQSDLVLVATGSEVWVAAEAAATLAKQGMQARVVSMPCVELFRELSAAEQEAIIPGAAKKVLLEAGTSFGWAEIVGKDALFVCRDEFGASAPGEQLADEFGFTPEKVVEKITGWLK
jgi:transketolase